MMTDILVSLLIGIFSGLGVGSGGLLIVYLVGAHGMDQLCAQGMSLAFFAFALGAAVLVHLMHRHLSPTLLSLILLFGCTGAVLGSLAARVSDTALLRTALGVLLTALGLYSLFKH